MSEEKLYVVKNDEGKYWDFSDSTGFWSLVTSDHPITPSKEQAEQVADNKGGHVVTFVEEPKKVVLSEEQAKIVEDARDSGCPANYIFSKSGSEGDKEMLMKAYVNGYTVAKEKKYNVKVPHAEGWHFHKYSSASKLGPRNNWKPFPAKDTDSNISKGLFQFTESEIEHYGLQDCEKEEVTDDGMGC